MKIYSRELTVFLLISLSISIGALVILGNLLHHLCLSGCTSCKSSWLSDLPRLFSWLNCVLFGVGVVAELTEEIA